MIMMRYLICPLFALFSVATCAQQSSPAPDAVSEAVSADYAPVVVPPLPASLDFAGEAVPLDNYDTRESLLRELMTGMYLHSRTMQTLLATTRYFPVIEPIMAKYGVPDDFKYLCMAESGLSPEARSGAGAAGLWQLMAPTAKDAGLLVVSGVDERYHIEKATETACKFLVDAKKRLGSWTLAAAAYNAGVAGVTKRMQTQGIDSYYDLYLPEETMRYVFRILAFKLMTPDPSVYGFRIAEDDYYGPLTDYREETVDDAAIDWSAVARRYGTNYKMLRELNHWIRDYRYDNKSRRGFVIRIPNEGFRSGK